MQSLNFIWVVTTLPLSLQEAGSELSVKFDMTGRWEESDSKILSCLVLLSLVH